MQRVQILGIPIDTLSFSETLEKIRSFLREEEQRHVATPNPEMLVEAQKNIIFREILKKTALNIPDGIGLIWAMKKVARKNLQPSTFNLQHIERVTGTDMLISLCYEGDHRVFLLGAAPGIAEQAGEILKEKNPSLQIVGTYSGSPSVDEEQSIVQMINDAGPTLLFVAYGAPLQDIWIDRNLQKMPGVKVAMGIGGAFDFITGKQKRAPRWMQKMGLEWLWRLMREPNRVGRIWNAVVVFPFIILTRFDKKS